MSSDDVVISARSLTKTYHVYGNSLGRVRQKLDFSGKKYYQEFTALKGVSFDIRRGEAVGIVGRNGSGKSTLLQVVCGILKPDMGSIQVQGRVSALLELGAGFHPELTGRENVYMQCAIMGMTRGQIEEKFNDIELFADIGRYIDQPVRTYSSGMYVRLAFSVAVSADPEILIVDEALSVGDAMFQHKSKRKIQQLRDSGTSLLLVSHDRYTITGMCNRSILLNEGQLVMDAAPGEVMDYYYAKLASKTGVDVSRRSSSNGQIQTVSGTGEAVVERISLLDKNGQAVEIVTPGEEVTLEFQVFVNQEIPCLVLGFTVRDQFGQIVYGINTNSFEQALTEVSGNSRYIFRFSFNVHIGVGTYSISTDLVSTNDRLTNNYESRDLAHFFTVDAKSHKIFGGLVWLDTSLEISEAR